jgi:phage gp46-like protein
MAFTSSGKDIALRESPSAPGRFTFDWDASGNPRFDDDRAHAVITTLVSWKRGRAPGQRIEQGGYYWDETGQRGTLIWTVRYDTLATQSTLVACAEDAGQQLVQAQVIKSLTARASRIGPGRWRLDVEWTLPDGRRPPPAQVRT